eukprot:jgi/Botrbrau1/17529/Bobra.0529s0001.1
MLLISLMVHAWMISPLLHRLFTVYNDCYLYCLQRLFTVYKDWAQLGRIILVHCARGSVAPLGMAWFHWACRLIVKAVHVVSIHGFIGHADYREGRARGFITWFHWACRLS